MSSEKKIKGYSSTRRGLLGPVPLPEEWRMTGILHEHRDNNDFYNFPPAPMYRGTGHVDAQEGAKTKHLASAYNISAEQNNVQINHLSGNFPAWKYIKDDAMHTAASAFTNVPTSNRTTTERLQREYKPSTIKRHLAGAKNPSWRPRSDDDREAF